MENQPNQQQPAVRQWFRLASLARLEALGQGPSQAPANTAPGSTNLSSPKSQTQPPPISRIQSRTQTPTLSLESPKVIKQSPEPPTVPQLKPIKTPPPYPEPPSPKRETANNGAGMVTTSKKKDECGEMKVTMLAGENMGAYMELGPLQGQHINRKQQRGYSS